MPARSVNLDALIVREDFEYRTERPPLRESGDFKVTDLEEKSIIYGMLRKPDFQRETANWPPEKVVQLIKNFLDDNLIPSIIMWRSPATGNIFVIDGAHRLSALIAWVHDDYGDRAVSRQFFREFIPEYQKKVAQETRQRIKDDIGTYDHLKFLATHPDKDSTAAVQRSRNLALLPIALQWVRGDAANAEASFFTINQSATPIHPAEMRIIASRRKPNALGARAVMQAGAGHKYWQKFSADAQGRIETAAVEISKLLFSPSLQEPIKTLDLPLAGPDYSVDRLGVVFDFVNFCNGVRWQKPASDGTTARGRKRVADTAPVLEDDEDGSTTLVYLEAAKKLASRLAGMHPGSLGVHPFVYVYTATGRFQPTAFLAVTALVQYLEEADRFREFTAVRSRFEEFILEHRYFVNAIARKFGSGIRGLNPLLTMYKVILAGMWGDQTDEDTVRQIYADEQFRFLAEAAEENKRRPQRRFSREAKSEAFLREAKDSALLCAICHARVPKGSLTWDHEKRLRDGGLGDAENAQPAHPYCNTTFKN
jgi:hypothetical protein